MPQADDAQEPIDVQALPVPVPSEMLAQLQRAYDTDPDAVIDRGIKQAKALMRIVKANPKSVVNIQGHDYPKVEIWSTLGRFNRMTAKTEWTRPMGGGSYEARVQVVNMDTGIVIGAAESECSRDEEKWAKSLGYSVRSMAQTRAESKAFRMLLSWVVVLAGMEPTPAEEVPPSGFTSKLPKPVKPTQPPKTKEKPAQKPFPLDEERRVLVASLFRLANEYGEIGGETGREQAHRMNDREERHAAILRRYKVPGLRFCSVDQLRDLETYFKDKVDEIQDANRREP